MVDDKVIERYLARVGSDGGDVSVAALQLAHVRAVVYEDLDIHLGRRIRLDVPNLVAKLVDGGRGGYCYEQNTLFATVLEGLGYSVTRCLGRIRMRDAESPLPATHMVLIVDGHLVDVGLGGPTPLGPVPLGGEVTYGGFSWRTERGPSPEGEDVWWLRLGDKALYTFADRPQHPVDYIAPNHYSSTHPESIFLANTIVQRWDERNVQIGLVGLDLSERHADGTIVESTVDAADYGLVLKERFGLSLNDDELGRLTPIRAR